MFSLCLQCLPVTASGTPPTLVTQTPGTPWVSLQWSRQRLFLLNITFVDEALINEDITKTILHYT